MIPSSRNEIQLRSLVPDDWQLWREVRLEALKEAPYAFGSKLADWQGERDTEVRWRGRLTAVPLNLMAEWRQMPAGMAGGTAPNPEGSAVDRRLIGVVMHRKFFVRPVEHVEHPHSSSRTVGRGATFCVCSFHGRAPEAISNRRTLR